MLRKLFLNISKRRCWVSDTDHLNYQAGRRATKVRQRERIKERHKEKVVLEYLEKKWVERGSSNVMKLSCFIEVAVGFRTQDNRTIRLEGELPR